MSFKDEILKNKQTYESWKSDWQNKINCYADIEIEDIKLGLIHDAKNGKFKDGVIKGKHEFKISNEIEKNFIQGDFLPPDAKIKNDVYRIETEETKTTETTRFLKRQKVITTTTEFIVLSEAATMMINTILDKMLEIDPDIKITPTLMIQMKSKELFIFSHDPSDDDYETKFREQYIKISKNNIYKFNCNNLAFYDVRFGSIGDHRYKGISYINLEIEYSF